MKKVYIFVVVILVFILQIKTDKYEASKSGLDLIEPVLALITLPASLIIVPIGLSVTWLTINYVDGLGAFERPFWGICFIGALIINLFFFLPRVKKLLRK